MKKASFAEFKRLAALALPYWFVLLIAMLALAGGSAINLYLPQVLREILNHPSGNYLSSHLISVGQLLLGLFALQAVCFYLRSYLFGVTGQRIITDLRKKLYQATINQSVPFFDESRVGDLVSRVNSDCAMLQDAVSVKLSVLVRYSLQVIVGTLLMLFISLKLTLLILVALPVLIGASIFLGIRLKRLSKLQQENLGHATTIAEETFSSARLVKAFNRESFESIRFGRSADDVLAAGIKRSKLAAFLASFVSFLMNACIVLIMLFGIKLVTEATLTTGDLTAFLLYGVIVAISFAFLSGAYSDFVQALGAAERIFEIIDSPARELPTNSNLTPVDRANMNLIFKNVSFSYPARPDVVVLDKVSFELPAGGVTALVGPSGSGKSTIVNLILRFYAPDSGSITVGPTDIAELDLQLLREQIAIVPQDPEFFAASIAHNLRYGKQEATLDELIEATKRTNLYDFISTLPDQFDTRVGPRGVQLSGGQKQRLAIARALLKDPSVLLLDEATSALDSENEHLVQLALRDLMKGRTSLVIAHRLSTVQNADQVLVIEHGNIIQTGTHATLSHQPGLYQELVKRQEISSPRAATA